MDIGTLLTQAGVAGVGLYLFATGKLVAQTVVEAITKVYDARLRDMAERLAEMRKDRDAWRSLALGTERRLDVAAPTVAVAIGAPVPSPLSAPTEGT
jgi:hypothetical protein